MKYLSRKDIRHVGSKGVGEILKRLPGIVVQGPPMAYRNVKVNGLDKEYQTILIDGFRPAGGEDRREFKLDRLPASLVEGVEIIYNSGVEYGGSSPAGVINIKTKGVPKEREIGADIGLDKTATAKGWYPDASFYLGNSKKRIGFLLYGGIYRYSRMDKRELKDIGSTISGETKEWTEVGLKTMAARFNYQFNQNQLLKLKILGSYQDQTETILANVNRRTQGGLQYRQDSSMEISARSLFQLEAAHELSLKAWQAENSVRWDISGLKKKKDRSREGSPNWEISEENEAQILNLVGLHSRWSRNSLQIGQVLHNFRLGTDLSTNQRNFDRMAYAKQEGHLFWDEVEDGSYFLQENTAAVYFTDQLEREKLSFSPGVRVEYQHRWFTTAVTNGSSGLVSILPAIHGKIDLASSWIMRGGLSRQNALQPFLYLVPVQKVKHKKELIEMGNPDLKPARSWNYNWSLQKLFGEQSYMKLQAFYTPVRDVVEMRYLGVDEAFNYRIFKPVNVDSAQLYGLSLDWLYRSKDFSNSDLRFWGNCTFNGSKLLDPGNQEIRRLNDQPASLFNINADYLLTRFRLRAAVAFTWISKRYTSATIDPSGSLLPGFYYDAFGQLDASFKYYFSRWGYFSLSVHNLLQATEKLHQNGVVEELFPGRLVRFGLSLTF